jgi:hypothetical protein
VTRATGGTTPARVSVPPETPQPGRGYARPFAPPRRRWSAPPRHVPPSSLGPRAYPRSPPAHAPRPTRDRPSRVHAGLPSLGAAAPRPLTVRLLLRDARSAFSLLAAPLAILGLFAVFARNLLTTPPQLKLAFLNPGAITKPRQQQKQTKEHQRHHDNDHNDHNDRHALLLVLSSALTASLPAGPVNAGGGRAETKSTPTETE